MIVTWHTCNRKKKLLLNKILKLFKFQNFVHTYISVHLFDFSSCYLSSVPIWLIKYFRSMFLHSFCLLIVLNKFLFYLAVNFQRFVCFLNNFWIISVLAYLYKVVKIHKPCSSPLSRPRIMRVPPLTFLYRKNSKNYACRRRFKELHIFINNLLRVYCVQVLIISVCFLFFANKPFIRLEQHFTLPMPIFICSVCFTSVIFTAKPYYEYMNFPYVFMCFNELI